MARTALEARERILADLAVAIEAISLATASLGLAYEQLDEATGERLEAELFRPAQRAFGRAKRTQSQFGERFGLPAPVIESRSPGLASQGVKALVDRAVTASADASRAVAELQDSMLPIEAGDAELRSGLAEVRALLDELPGRSRGFLRTLGR